MAKLKDLVGQTDWLDDIQLRLDLSYKLRDWGVPQDEAYDMIARLCGLDHRDMLGWDDRCNEICRKLLGPNGYALYKMILAREDDGRQVGL